MSNIFSSTQTKKTSVRAYHVTIINFCPAITLSLEYAPLDAVYIYFDTATYDEIERDEKVALEASPFGVYFEQQIASPISSNYILEYRLANVSILIVTLHLLQIK